MVCAKLGGLDDTHALSKYLSICLKLFELVLMAPDDHESKKWGWEKDKETKIPAQGLHAGIRRSEFFMAFVEVKNFTHLLIGMIVKLQKRDDDTLVAYNMMKKPERHARF